MFGLNRFPYTSITEINLDWIMRKLKEVAPAGADNPVSYDPQSKTPEEQQQARDNIGIVYPVESVCGKTGAVTLDASDVGALADTYTPPVESVCGKTGAVTLDASDVGALADTYTPPVSSVCGKTGAVTLNASDVGALADTYTPPVSSVNGLTGSVVLTAATVGALPVIKGENANDDGVQYDLSAAPFWIIITANSQYDYNTGVWICFTSSNIVQKIAGTTSVTMTMTSGILTITTVDHSAVVWAIKLPNT